MLGDNRGRYARISDGLFPQARSTLLGHATRFLSPTHPARQKRRLLLLVGGVAAFLFASLLLHATLSPTTPTLPPAPRPLDTINLDDLALPLDGKNVSNANGETTFIVGEHHAVLGNYPLEYVWRDPATREPFADITYTNGMNNNAMGRMPAGSPYDVLVIARGRNGKYTDAREKLEYMNLTIVGFFANYDAATGRWERAGPEPYILDLPIWRQFPRPCQNLVNGGPADPRFIWSDAGEPLAIIGTSSRVADVCKAVGIVDLRAAWPALREHLEQIGHGDIPVRFDTFTEVGRTSSKEHYEKNWAAFFSGPKPKTEAAVVEEKSWWAFRLPSWGRGHTLPPASAWPYFASQIEPRNIVKVNPALSTKSRASDSYALGDDLDLSLPRASPNDAPASATSECLYSSLPKDWKKGSFHQATAFYRMTLCPRGTCTPSRDNTVLLGLVHYKLSRRTYRRMFVTMGVDEPFQILSVSPSLHFGSAEIDEDVVFSVSITFMPTNNATDLVEGQSPFLKSTEPPSGHLSHGWLDDTVVVGAGLRDEAYDAIHMPAVDALRGHTLCPRQGR
ncbi:hypothetical protein F5X68DRAFT_57009 [Plectosphaerella plurivora]|uniref:Uncharacterized protein n=1 Tax=Plectosphaerella plurivora TaxID=936078 RepID=A0A9P8VG42_9PEZI|nr:hypothetical protein F5X68DRAFT_57009 [Plectosphaerella plurivora]